MRSCQEILVREGIMAQVHSSYRNALTAIAKCWQRFKDVFDLDTCEMEVKRLASDLGISATELRRLTAEGPEAARELHDRLAALHLVQEASAEPFIMRDLERVCSHCVAKRRCNSDLERGAISIDDDHCPNHRTLIALAHLSRAASVAERHSEPY